MFEKRRDLRIRLPVVCSGRKFSKDLETRGDPTLERGVGLEVKGPSEDHLKCNSIAVFHMINLIVSLPPNSWYPFVHKT